VTSNFITTFIRSENRLGLNYSFSAVATKERKELVCSSMAFVMLALRARKML
jgi:hypothetical protein